MTNRYVVRVDRHTEANVKTTGGGCCLFINKELQFVWKDVPYKNLDVIIGYLTKTGILPVVIVLHYL